MSLLQWGLLAWNNCIGYRVSQAFIIYQKIIFICAQFCHDTSHIDLTSVQQKQFLMIWIWVFLFPLRFFDGAMWLNLTLLLNAPKSQMILDFNIESSDQILYCFICLPGKLRIRYHHIYHDFSRKLVCVWFARSEMHHMFPTSERQNVHQTRNPATEHVDHLESSHPNSWVNWLMNSYSCNQV